MTICLSINGYVHPKNHFDKRKQVQAAATSKTWSDSGWTSFSALQFSRQKEALIVGWLQVILSLHFQISFCLFAFFCFVFGLVFCFGCSVNWGYLKNILSSGAIKMHGINETDSFLFDKQIIVLTTHIRSKRFW